MPKQQEPKRKLIEVALPLEAINRESAREKSIRHGHPSTLHLWWARRPLAAARAVLFAQLVDDPSSRTEEFPTEELQRKERDRLHRLMERLVVWENIRDEQLLAEANAEILKCFNGNPPKIVDPFAGGGTIPLEAQRLGMSTYASDLNPVAVLINKALIEIPPRFRDRAPIFPDLAGSQIRDWSGCEGIAADIRAYGTWIRTQADKQIGNCYPSARRPDGSSANVLAWMWARTVTCPNPACGIEMPLVRTWWLCKKKGREAYIVPRVVDDSHHPSGRRVEFEIGSSARNAPSQKDDGTIAQGNARCVACDASVTNAYIRGQANSVTLGQRMLAVIADGGRERIYLAPSRDDEDAAARVTRPADAPDQLVPVRNHDVDRLPMYGMPTWSDAFTPRQLRAMTTFSDLVSEARALVIGHGGSEDYADAIATYLGLASSRCADYWSSICSWANTRESVRNVFGRQAIPMTWDFTEVMPFSDSSGGYIGQVAWVAKVIEASVGREAAIVDQADAANRSYEGLVISTDPPYYDNIGYSDLSDYFYVWLRRSLRPVHPKLFSTMLVPKDEELTANPYRHGGKAGAKQFFEDGFYQVFAKARHDAPSDAPITVYYAFKQSESDGLGDASTGWETLLEGMIRAGWEITSTWPLRSERGGRMISVGTNALASSIVLSLRPRSGSSDTTDRRGFIEALETELPEALRKLQQGQIAPVDLPQAAIGPGMAVFSRYRAILEPDGTSMTVRAALQRINETLDRVLSEQEGDFDPPTRFAIAWYRQHGYKGGRFGDADNLARARNTSVEIMDRNGILTSRAGNVQLLKPNDLPTDYDPVIDSYVSHWEVLQHLIATLERDGIATTSDLLRAALSRSSGDIDPDLVKELAHLLFRIAESNAWTADALSFNNIVTVWPEVVAAAGSNDREQVAGQQSGFDFEVEES